MKALLTVASPDQFQLLPKRKVRLHGVNFDEDFLAELVAKHLTKQRWQVRHRLSDAFEIYMRENPSAHRRKFQIVAHHVSIPVNVTADSGNMTSIPVNVTEDLCCAF